MEWDKRITGKCGVWCTMNYNERLCNIQTQMPSLLRQRREWDRRALIAQRRHLLRKLCLQSQRRKSAPAAAQKFGARNGSVTGCNSLCMRESSSTSNLIRSLAFQIELSTMNRADRRTRSLSWLLVVVILLFVVLLAAVSLSLSHSLAPPSN